MKAPVTRKLAVRHTKLVCLSASFLATGAFKFKLFQNACMVYKYITVAAFRIYAHLVNMLLKGEVGGPALSGPFPAIFGKGPWPKLGKNNRLNIKFGRNKRHRT